MWKPVEQWSHLISLAIYHPLSSGDSGLPQPPRSSGGAVHRQVSWLVLAKKGRRDSATIATIGVRGDDQAESRGPTAEKAEKHEANRGGPRRI